METPHPLHRALTVGRPASPSGQPRVINEAEHYFDARLGRLQGLVSESANQSKRLDAAVYRLSGLAAPGQTGSDDAAPAPGNVLARLDLSIDYFEEIVKRTGEHLNRLETL